MNSQTEQNGKTLHSGMVCCHYLLTASAKRQTRTDLRQKRQAWESEVPGPWTRQPQVLLGHTSVPGNTPCPPATGPRKATPSTHSSSPPCFPLPPAEPTPRKDSQMAACPGCFLGTCAHISGGVPGSSPPSSISRFLITGDGTQHQPSPPPGGTGLSFKAKDALARVSCGRKA